MPAGWPESSCHQWYWSGGLLEQGSPAQGQGEGWVFNGEEGGQNGVEIGARCR